jgi:hypothetical protein
LLTLDGAARIVSLGIERLDSRVISRRNRGAVAQFRGGSSMASPVRAGPHPEEVQTMTRVITALYETKDQVTNALDELVSTCNIPRDQIRVDEDKPQIQVLMPDVTEGDVEEVLRRYSPKELRT